MIIYQIEPNLSLEEFKAVLVNSTLGERRPVEDEETLQKMLSNAQIIITARNDGKIVGVSRSISDFAYCTYLSDLAVDVDFQKMGIGKQLIKETKKCCPFGKLILLSAPAAVEYYPKIGMTKHEHSFYISDANEIVE